jgi:hypothetical protein
MGSQRLPSGKRYRWEIGRDGEEITVDVSCALSLDDSDLMVEAALEGLESPVCRNRWLGLPGRPEARGCSSGLVTPLAWSHAVLPGQSSRAVGSSGIHRPSLGDKPPVAVGKE